MKQRLHREWFRAVELGGRKSCPTCHAKLEPKEWIWSWGQFINAKFRLIRYCCKSCWKTVQSDLYKHARDCGCSFELVAKHAPKPSWMMFDAEFYSRFLAETTIRKSANFVPQTNSDVDLRTCQPTRQTRIVDSQSG